MQIKRVSIKLSERISYASFGDIGNITNIAVTQEK